LDVPTPKVTAAAFFKARLKFSATAFVDLNRQVINHFYQAVTAQTWNGHRVLAVEGVKYHLPDEEAIHTEFGGQSNQHTDEVPMALGSALYDIHQKIILDAQLFPYRSDEREVAFKHLEATQAGDLILYDSLNVRFEKIITDANSIICAGCTNLFYGSRVVIKLTTYQ
jgi:hypothetical protein